MNATYTRTIPREVPPWMAQLKTAFDAGYYKTEDAWAQQAELPRQSCVFSDHVCVECGFWFHSRYFDASLCARCAPDYCTAAIGVGKD